MATSSVPASEPTPHLAPEDRLEVARTRRRARNSQGLTELFEERDDLRGVSPVADFFAESVRWTA